MQVLERLPPTHFGPMPRPATSSSTSAWACRSCSPPSTSGPARSSAWRCSWAWSAPTPAVSSGTPLAWLFGARSRAAGGDGRGIGRPVPPQVDPPARRSTTCLNTALGRGSRTSTGSCCCRPDRYARPARDSRQSAPVRMRKTLQDSARAQPGGATCPGCSAVAGSRVDLTHPGSKVAGRQPLLAERQPGTGVADPRSAGDATGIGLVGGEQWRLGSSSCPRRAEVATAAGVRCRAATSA
jgi:hypothetical protein